MKGRIHQVCVGALRAHKLESVTFASLFVVPNVFALAWIRQTYWPYFNAWSYDTNHYLRQVVNLFDKGFSVWMLADNSGEQWYPEHAVYTHNPNWQRFLGLPIWALSGNNPRVFFLLVLECVLLIIFISSLSILKALPQFRVSILLFVLSMSLLPSWQVVLLSPYRAWLAALPLTIAALLMSRHRWAWFLAGFLACTSDLIFGLAIASALVTCRHLGRRSRTCVPTGAVVAGVVFALFLFAVQIVGYLGFQNALREGLSTLSDRSGVTLTQSPLLNSETVMGNFLFLLSREFSPWWACLVLLALYPLVVQRLQKMSATRSHVVRPSETVKEAVGLIKLWTILAMICVGLLLLLPKYMLGLQGTPGGYFPGYMPLGDVLTSLTVVSAINGLRVLSPAVKGSTLTVWLGVGLLAIYGLTQNASRLGSQKVSADWALRALLESDVPPSDAIIMDFDPNTYVDVVRQEPVMYATNARKVVQDLRRSRGNASVILVCDDTLRMEYQKFMYPTTCEEFLYGVPCTSQETIRAGLGFAVKRCTFVSK